jgi:hypothetical protein
MLLHDLTLKWICTHELIEIGIIRQIYIYNTKQSDFLLIWSIQQLNSSIWWKTFPRISSVSHVRLLFVVYIYAPLSLSNPNILRVGLPTWFIRHHLVVMYVKVYGVYVDVYGELSRLFICLQTARVDSSYSLTRECVVEVLLSLRLLYGECHAMESFLIYSSMGRNFLRTLLEAFPFLISFAARYQLSICRWLWCAYRDLKFKFFTIISWHFREVPSFKFIYMSHDSRILFNNETVWLYQLCFNFIIQRFRESTNNDRIQPRILILCCSNLQVST